MEIKHDYSYINDVSREFMKRGYAQEDLYSLRFQFVYTEEQRKENSLRAQSVSSEDYTRLLEDAMWQRNEHMQSVLNAIAAKHLCYQYNVGSDIAYRSGDYDLFFWCNSSFGKRDYSYFTLSFNKHHTIEKRREICASVLRILEAYLEDQNLNVAVQYDVLYNNAEINEAVRLLSASMDGRRCFYNGSEGKIVLHGDQFSFKRKYAKKYGCRLSNQDVLYLSWALNKEN